MPLFQRTKRWLRRNYPCPLTLTVRVRPPHDEFMLGVAGWFVPEESGYGTIYIAQGADGNMSETLIEEWCHALRHACPLLVDYEGEPHDMIFWSIYGEVTNKWRTQFFANRDETV